MNQPHRNPRFQFSACIVLYVVNALLLAAHFLRAGQVVLTALCLIAPSLFFYRQRSGLRLMQLLAGCAAMVWLVTAARLVMVRIALGQPWKMAVAILGTVALLNVAAALLFNTEAVKRRYPTSPDSA